METSNSSVEMILSGSDVPAHGYDESDKEFDSVFTSECEIADSVMLARKKSFSFHRARSVDMGDAEYDDIEDDMLSDDEYDLPLNDSYESTHNPLGGKRKATNRIPSPTHDYARGSPAVNIMEEGESYSFQPHCTSRKTRSMSCGSIPTTISLPNSPIVVNVKKLRRKTGEHSSARRH
jgi:hypothetical protein